MRRPVFGSSSPHAGPMVSATGDAAVASPPPIEQGPAVIRVTRLNGEHFALNPDLIERVEGHPDTVLFLVDGHKYIVSEAVDDVLDEIREYRASILATAYAMDRGTYRTPSTPGDDAPRASVVPFPAREER